MYGLTALKPSAQVKGNIHGDVDIPDFKCGTHNRIKGIRNEQSGRQINAVRLLYNMLGGR